MSGSPLPTRLNRLSAVAFFLGGSLFALGAFLAQVGTTTLATVNITYLVGGFFFSLGAYASIVLVANTGPEVPEDGVHSIRLWSTGPSSRASRSAVVLFVGTLLFAVSLVAAFASGFTPRQSDGWIWCPDMSGCVCFLWAGRLALQEVSGGGPRWLPRDLSWWAAAVNQLGSVLFFLAGVAAFVRPATSAELDAQLVNWGTFAGALLFAVGAILQFFTSPSPTRTVVRRAS